MNVSAAVGLAVGVVTLVGAVGTAFLTVATKDDVEKTKHEVLTIQQEVAGAQTQMHKLDYYDNRLELIERELLYLEEKEEIEGLTASEQRRLDRLMEDMEYYEQREEETRDKLMEIK